jgi:hypothetical protein
VAAKVAGLNAVHGMKVTAGLWQSGTGIEQFSWPTGEKKGTTMQDNLFQEVNMHRL